MNRYAMNRTDHPPGMVELWVVARDVAHVHELIRDDTTIRDATALEWSAATVTFLGEETTTCPAGVMIGARRATTAGFREPVD